MGTKADCLDNVHDRIDLARGGVGFHYNQHMVRKVLSSELTHRFESVIAANAGSSSKTSTGPSWATLARSESPGRRLRVIRKAPIADRAIRQLPRRRGQLSDLAHGQIMSFASLASK